MRYYIEIIKDYHIKELNKEDIDNIFLSDVCWNIGSEMRECINEVGNELNLE